MMIRRMKSRTTEWLRVEYRVMLNIVAQLFDYAYLLILREFVYSRTHHPFAMLEAR